MASSINLQLPTIILKKLTLSDMHHRKTYMHINFQQNQVSTSVKTMHTNLFARNCKLHKFATSVNLLFFFGKMIFIVCEQKNRQKNTNKCYIQHT